MKNKPGLDIIKVKKALEKPIFTDDEIRRIRIFWKTGKKIYTENNLQLLK